MRVMVAAELASCLVKDLIRRCGGAAGGGSAGSGGAAAGRNLLKIAGLAGPWRCAA